MKQTLSAGTHQTDKLNIVEIIFLWEVNDNSDDRLSIKKFIETIKDNCNELDLEVFSFEYTDHVTHSDEDEEDMIDDYIEMLNSRRTPEEKAWLDAIK